LFVLIILTINVPNIEVKIPAAANINGNKTQESQLKLSIKSEDSIKMAHKTIVHTIDHT
jgi:biopolymer transport protein ExbD